MKEESRELHSQIVPKSATALRICLVFQNSATLLRVLNIPRTIYDIFPMYQQTIPLQNGQLVSETNLARPASHILHEHSHFVIRRILLQIYIKCYNNRYKLNYFIQIFQ